MSEQQTYTAFLDACVVAAGEADVVARAAHAAGAPGVVLVLDDRTGRPVDLDLTEGAPRIAGEPVPVAGAPPKAGRGRPRLGVVAREVTLLPRHWDWLSRQPGGASAALRRLVEDARRQRVDRVRESRDAAYAAMTALAGDRPGYEDAVRALYAADRPRLEALLTAWPADVADYLRRLLA